MKSQEQLQAELEKIVEHIKAVRDQRNRRIDAMRIRYQIKLAPFQERLSAIRELLHKSRPGTMLEKYTEPKGTPPHFCPGCKQELLRASLENAGRILKRGLLDRPATALDVRRMALQEYCCHRCRKGKEGHSCWCSRKSLRGYKLISTSKTPIPDLPPTEQIAEGL